MTELTESDEHAPNNPAASSDAKAEEENEPTSESSGGGGGYEGSWEPGVAAEIAERARALRGTGCPLMVALVGVPGSGKSVSAFLLASGLEAAGLPTMIMPHDGYHYFLDHLRTFPDHEEVIYHRGAPHTFDADGLARDLKRVRGGDEVLIKLPGFDHSVGDPEPDKHIFDRNAHRVVICEGLYLLHDRDGWENVRSHFDYSIYMDSDLDACIERVKIRNQCIPGYTPEEIAVRCEVVDRANAIIVQQSKSRADVVVQSVALKPSKSRASLHTPTHSYLDLASMVPLNIEEINGDTGIGDWTQDIVSRPRADSLASYTSSRPRSESLVSNVSDVEPAAASVGGWEPAMADRIRHAVETTDIRPYMVALVGIPGSGKTVSGFLLASKLEEHGINTMVMPHDGYHYTVDYLRTCPDPEDLIYRRGTYACARARRYVKARPSFVGFFPSRSSPSFSFSIPSAGAPDTFDPASLMRDLRRIRDGDEDLIKVPAFDHSKGDPEPDSHVFDRNSHEVVLCEGLYLLHNGDGWENIAGMFDLTVFMNADLETCMDRVKIRNQCIPGYTSEEIAARVERVDRVNALTVLSSKARADVVVDSAAATTREQ
jgi:pantothenate kinase